MDTIKLLLVEDDNDLRIFMKDNLEMTGEYTVYEAKDGFEGLKKFKEIDLDIIVADIDMPKMSGLVMIDLIRQENKNIPILITSGLVTPEKVKEGLMHDIDNYIKKPYTYVELDNYIKALFRRIEKNNQLVTEDQKVFPLGAYTFDLENRCLKYKNEIIPLSKRQALILYMLYRDKGKIVKRSAILKEFWGVEDDPYHTRSLDVFITKLRNSLKQDKSIEIATLRGDGLKLIVPD